MSESTLVKKLKLRPGHRGAVVNTPEGYLKQLGPLPPDVVVVEKLERTFDRVKIFVKNKTSAAGSQGSLEERLP